MRLFSSVFLTKVWGPPRTIVFYLIAVPNTYARQQSHNSLIPLRIRRHSALRWIRGLFRLGLDPLRWCQLALSGFATMAQALLERCSNAARTVRYAVRSLSDHGQFLYVYTCKRCYTYRLWLPMVKMLDWKWLLVTINRNWTMEASRRVKQKS